MLKQRVLLGLLVITHLGCNTSEKKTEIKNVDKSIVQVVGAMKNVMWKGELVGTINLDTINDKNGLYGLGPVEYLVGELLVVDGKSYVSTVTSDSIMDVKETYKVKAPFFVYANKTDWNVEYLPSDIRTLKDLERFMDQKAYGLKKPFVFKLKGQVESAKIHVQNLPRGVKVSSPNEAHQGQVSYVLKNIEVDIIGFFSTKHKGVFTHHDSNVHMHLITSDRKKMGHLDELLLGTEKIKIYLPK